VGIVETLILVSVLRLFGKPMMALKTRILNNAIAIALGTELPVWTVDFVLYNLKNARDKI